MLLCKPPFLEHRSVQAARALPSEGCGSILAACALSQCIRSECAVVVPLQGFQELQAHLLLQHSDPGCPHPQESAAIVLLL